MKPYKVLITIFAAAAIASLGLDRQGGQLAEAEADTHPVDEYFDSLMPRYPRVQEFPLGQKMQLGEGEVKMSYFATKDPPLRVARYYETVWQQEGLEVHKSVTPQGGVVGTYDPRVGSTRAITIATYDNTTWVFPAMVDRPLDTARSGDLGADLGLPVFPDSSTGLTMRSSDQGRETLVTTYSNSGGMEENITFYRQELFARGWQERDVPVFEEMQGHRTLTFGRGSQRLDINLTPVGEGDNVVVCAILSPEG